MASEGGIRPSMGKINYVVRNTPRLSLQGARLVMAAATRKAAALRVPMDIAVVDDGGHLIVFNRMDGAKLSSIDIAISKAWTAACSRRPTHEYAEIAGPGRPAYGIHMTNDGRFTIVGGGLPIRIGNGVLGGIGCSGGTTLEMMMSLTSSRARSSTEKSERSWMASSSEVCSRWVLSRQCAERLASSPA